MAFSKKTFPKRQFPMKKPPVAAKKEPPMAKNQKAGNMAALRDAAFTQKRMQGY